MPRKYKKSIKPDQTIQDPAARKAKWKADLQKQKDYRYSIREKLATDNTLNDKQKLELVIDYIVGGEI